MVKLEEIDMDIFHWLISELFKMQACVRVESKNDDTPPVMNKEAGPRKDKKINKIFAQYYKPSAGVKNLFNPHPKHPKPSNSD